MNCEQCGACCLNESPGVSNDYLTPEEFIDVAGGCMKTSGGTCVAFDGSARQCRIYEMRPKNCRSLKIGSAECLLSRLWVTLDLDWFGGSPKWPEEGAFENFISKISFGKGLSIVAIEGHTSTSSLELIKTYNEQLLAETT